MDMNDDFESEAMQELISLSQNQAKKLFDSYKNGAKNSSIWNDVKNEVASGHDKYNKEMDGERSFIASNEDDMYFEFHQQVFDKFNSLFARNLMGELGEDWLDAVAWLYSNGFGDESRHFQLSKFYSVPAFVLLKISDWTNKVIDSFSPEEYDRFFESFVDGNAFIELNTFPFLESALKKLPEEKQKEYRETLKMADFFGQDVDNNIAIFKEYQAVIKPVVVNDNVIRREFAGRVAYNFMNIRGRAYAEPNAKIKLVMSYYERYALDRFYIPAFGDEHDNVRTFISDVASKIERPNVKASFLEIFKGELGNTGDSKYSVLVDKLSKS